MGQPSKLTGGRPLLGREVMNADAQRVMGTVIDRFNSVKQAHSQSAWTGLNLFEYDTLPGKIFADAGLVDLVGDLCQD